MPNRAAKYAYLSATSAGTVQFTEAPGAGGSRGPSETVIDNMIISVKAGAGNGINYVRLREGVTIIFEAYVYLTNGQSTNLIVPFAGGLRSGSPSLNVLIASESGTASAQIRALVEYHYE